MAQALSNGHGQGEGTVHLLLNAVRQASIRVEQAFTEITVLRTDMEAGRREDVNRLADKLEQGFERVAADARERESRLHGRLDSMDDKLIDVCDKGRNDHVRFDGHYQELRQSVLTLNHRLDDRDVRAEERRRIFSGFQATGTWIVEHGKDIGVILGMGLIGAKVFWPVSEPPPVTIQQPASAQIDLRPHTQDWPLNTGD